jgi:hypothetical protein
MSGKVAQCRTEACMVAGPAISAVKPETTSAMKPKVYLDHL